MNVYPNPTTSFLNINTTSSQVKAIIITIADMNGKEIKQLQFPLAVGENHASLSLSDIVKGIYLFKVAEAQEQNILYSEKLVIE